MDLGSMYWSFSKPVRLAGPSGVGYPKLFLTAPTTCGQRFGNTDTEATFTIYQTCSHSNDGNLFTHTYEV